MADKFDEMAEALTEKAADDYVINEVSAGVMARIIAAALRSADSAGYARCREDAVRLIELGYARPVATSWRPDGKHSKLDRCEHDNAMNEDCESCLLNAVRALPTSTDGASHG